MEESQVAVKRNKVVSENGVADSRFNDVPNGWKVEKLSEIAEVVGGSTPSRDNDAYWNGEIPWATPTDITKLRGPIISETQDRITEEGLSSASTYVLPAYSVLMTSRATIGACAVNTVPMATNQGFQSLVPSDGVNTWFLFYRMLATAAYMESLGAGSTFSEVSKSTVEKVEVLLPPLPEQCKIASVLYAVDQAIQQTEAVIQQTKRVKRGLMQDLFHSGLRNGKTKNVRRLGQVPAHWRIVQLDDVCDKITDGTHQSPTTQEEGFPYITSQNLRDWGFDFSDLKYIAEEDHRKITARCNPQAGDVLYVKDGANTGTVQVNTLDFEFSLLSSVALIRPTPDILESNFLKQLLSWAKFRRLMMSRMSGTGIPRLTVSKIKNSKIPLPPIEEQKEIRNVLNSFDDAIAKDSDRLRYAKRLKRGLMQDLLTGTVRTHDKAIEVFSQVKAHG